MEPFMVIELRTLVEYGVIGTLSALSFVTFWIGVERYLYYKNVSLVDFTDKNDLDIALTNYLTILSTIGANAVYIGLLGTVLGIMITFSAIGDTSMVDSKTIMKSLSYTLVATAAGICVALPAIVIYNLLVRKVEVLQAKWESLHGDN
jgi:biopolymer transport protein ExbB